MSILRQTQLVQQDYSELIKVHEIDADVLSHVFSIDAKTNFGVRLAHYSDAPYLQQAIQNSIDSLANWLLFGGTHYSVHTAKTWIEGSIDWAGKGLGYEFLIHHVDVDNHDTSYPPNKKILGGVCINPIEPGSRFANLGYWLTNEACGKGIITLAAMFVAHFAFTQLKLQRLELVIDTYNQASISVAHRLGASLEGKARNRLRINQNYHDAYVYSLTPADFGL